MRRREFQSRWAWEDLQLRVQDTLAEVGRTTQAAFYIRCLSKRAVSSRLDDVVRVGEIPVDEQHNPDQRKKEKNEIPAGEGLLRMLGEVVHARVSHREAILDPFCGHSTGN